MPTINSSPSIVNNGLVFYLDASNYAKSWKGAPTTNSVSSGYLGIHTYWNNSGTAIWNNDDNYVPRLFSNLPVMSMYKDTTGNSHIAHGYSTLSPGITYTVSTHVYIPSNAGTLVGSIPYIRPFPGNFSAGALEYLGSSDWNTWPRNRWIRISKTFTNSSTDTELYISCYLDNAGNSIYFTAPMIETGSFATPFITPGTSRSNTQAILDLTGRNTITASSLTYNSNGTFSFDGSSNHLTLGSDTNLIQGNQITVEAWVKTNVTGAYKKIFTNGNATGVYLSIGPSPYNTYFGVVTNGSSGGATWGTDISTTSFTHMVGTYNGSVCRLYVNGEEKASGSASGTMGTGSTVYVSGYASGSERWNGLIPVVKVYNRALNSSEVSQNFNALRSRYGL